DDALQPFVAGRTLRAKVIPLTKAPNHAARQQHRTARPRSLLVGGRHRAELACARGGGQSRHPRPRDDYLRANPGLCSTYSMRTRSGPQTKTARVFAASQTLSTMSASSASAMTGSTSSTSTATWFSNGFSAAPGSPGWNSTYAPPTSTRGWPAGDGGAGSKPNRSYASAVSAGSAE